MVVSTQHAEDIDQDEVREIVRPHVVNVLPEGWMCSEAKRRLTLREIFSSTILLLAWEKVKSVLTRCTIWVIVGDRRVQLAA